MGKVPAIRHGDTVVTECAAICAYLADAFPAMLMARDPTARAILMIVSAPVYMAAILGGPNSRAHLATNAAPRLARLCRRVGGRPWRMGDFTEGELAAMSWACELMGLAETAARFGDRVLWLNFEAFLDDPSVGLAAALTRLHGHTDQGDVAAMLRSPDLGRYSKAPEHPFDADQRRRILVQARIEHGREIERGLAWLERAGAAHPAIAAAGMAGAAHLA